MAEILITYKDKFYGAKEMDEHPDLKLIACPATRIEHVDRAEAKKRGIQLVDIAGEPGLKEITSTAEHALGLMLALVRKTVSSHNHVISGEWDRNKFQGRELKNMKCKTLGDEGRLGSIFRKLIYPLCKATAHTEGADILAVFVDKNPTSINLVDDAMLGGLNQGAYLVNVSASNIIDEDAVIRALDSGQLAGYATDVPNHPDDQPERPSPKLIDAAKRHNVIITPHIGGNTVEAREKAESILSEKLCRVRGASSTR